MSSPDVYLFPVTFSQQQLWYLNELDPDSTAYNIPLAFELEGVLDRSALERALVSVIARHDALRTSFRVVDGQVRQLVHAHQDVALHGLDLSHETDAVRQTRLRERKHAFARHHFDLAVSPLLAAELVKLDATQHVLLFCLHHIVVDHVSVLQIGRELTDAYAEIRRGQTPSATVGLQYPDYAVWQREHLTDDVLRDKLAYWSGVLAGKSQTLALPTDRVRPELQSFKGQELPIAFSEETSAGLRAYAQEHKLSAFVVMLSALGVLLQRYTGNRDIIVGCPFANRTSEELQDVVGLFMNLLPILVEVDPTTRFEQLAADVRRKVMRAQGLQDTPFEKIVQAVGVPRSAARNPLIQVWLTLQDGPLSLSLEGLVVKSEALHNGGAKLDLSFWFWDDGRVLRGLVEYNSDLFDPSTVGRFVEHLEQIVREVTLVKRSSISDIDLLTPAEREQSRRWNSTATDDVLPNLHDAFFRVAAADPQRVVLVTDRASITAGQLAEHADRIAAGLERNGVRAGQFVGVCLQRTEALVAALLGVQRLGAVHLPLDPTLPAERLAYMLEDSDTKVVLSEASTRRVLPTSGVEVLSVEVLGEERGAFRPGDIAGDQPAYLMYTSGSTGRPKGVLVPRRAVGNFLSAMLVRPGFEPSDVLLAVTTYAFDISVLELFLPLSVGATLRIADKSLSEDADALQACIRDEGITVLQATPSTWRLLRANGWEGARRLKALVGGEALSPELARWLVPRVRELWNMYGPTETTVWSTCQRIDDSNCDACPIGSPIANTTVRILDESLREQPAGIAGELVIGGLGLAAGYLNRPELTAERFALLASGERIYRTGDRAVLQPDGRLLHLGRSDEQVKIRGFRVELGEIEAVLSKAPDTDTVIVKDWRVSDSDHRLVAYCSSRSGAPLQAMSLRKHARGFLPAYMVPQHFVHVERFALNASGKIDRRALGPPSIQGVGTLAPESAPRNDAERYVAALWSELIGASVSSRTVNFFEAGGHSLLAIQAISRIKAERGVVLRPRDLMLENLAAIAHMLCGDADGRASGTSTRG
jgi:amino acid adenylation domain-containing protein